MECRPGAQTSQHRVMMHECPFIKGKLVVPRKHYFIRAFAQTMDGSFLYVWRQKAIYRKRYIQTDEADSID